MSTAFCRYDLRTTDVDGARAFYEQALGLDVARAGSGLAVWPLHEQARARGAPAHWLGHIGVAELAGAVQHLLGLGAQLLGPPSMRGADGEAFAILRDPCEAVVALRETSFRAEPAPVVWHQLHSTDVEKSWSAYAGRFGWEAAGTLDRGGPEGAHRAFRFGGGSRADGSVANTARLPGVHPHWLFFFPVADLAATLAKIAAHGGSALAPVTLPGGDRLAACEDPQKAAFGVVQRG